MSFDVDCAVIGRRCRRVCGGGVSWPGGSRQGISRRLLLLEKAPRVGKKLLATGNGTCNLSNVSATAAQYHGLPGAGRAALAAFPPGSGAAFFWLHRRGYL